MSDILSSSCYLHLYVYYCNYLVYLGLMFKNYYRIGCAHPNKHEFQYLFISRYFQSQCSRSLTEVGEFFIYLVTDSVNIIQKTAKQDGSVPKSIKDVGLLYSLFMMTRLSPLRNCITMRLSKAWTTNVASQLRRFFMLYN